MKNYNVLNAITLKPYIIIQFKETLVLSLICSKYGNNNDRTFKEDEQ